MINVQTSLPGELRITAQSGTATEKKPVRFEKCIGCADMGPACLGPNLLMLTISELRAWVKRWKEYYRLSGEQCAAIWNTPVGTVSRFLATQETDFKYMTVQGIIRGIITYGQPADQQFGDNPCPATSSEIAETVSAIESQLAEKTEECEKLAKKKLERADEYADHMAEQRENFEHRLSKQQETIDFLRQDLERARATSRDYLARIDRKNTQLDDRDEEIRQLNREKSALYDRILKMADTHSAQNRG